MFYNLFALTDFVDVNFGEEYVDAVGKKPTLPPANNIDRRRGLLGQYL